MSGYPHLFQEGGEHLLFFPKSARLYQLSEEAASLVARLPENLSAPVDGLASPISSPSPPLPESHELRLHEDLLLLMQRELQHLPPVAPRPEQEERLSSLHTFSIYLAQDCNMSCCYCWSRGGTFGKSGHLMAVEDAGAITALVLSFAETSGSDVISVNFYGGEPLLNFPALKRISEDLVRWEDHLGKTFRLAVNTNGSLLEGDAAQFLAGHIAHVAVSIDGREEIHNLQRPGKGGEPTWERIVRNVKSFPKPEILSLRATLTALSDPYLETFIHLTSLGVRQVQVEYCHEPGYTANPSYNQLIVPMDRQLAELREFINYYVDAISRYDKGGIPFVSNLFDEIKRLGRGNRTIIPCGAGRNTLAINSRGEIFPCIAFVDRENFKLEQTSLYQVLKTIEKGRQTHCAGCWLRYDCAGGCYATRFDDVGNSRLPPREYCEAMRGKGELYLFAISQMRKKCPWHLDG